MKDILNRDAPYKELQRRILDHEYMPGEILSIRQLAKELNVSTTPIREALVRLESDFLVDRTPHNSARVAGVTYKDVRDITEVRLALGRQCGLLATLRITESEKAECRAFLQEIKDAKDFETVMRADGKLHEALYAATRNAILQRFFLQIRYQVSHLYNLIEDEDVWCKIIYEEWCAILDAVFSGDGELSATLMGDHVQHFVSEMGKTLQLGPYSQVP